MLNVGVTRDEYIAQLIKEGKSDEEILKLLEEQYPATAKDPNAGKIMGPVNVEASAGPEDMASSSEDGSSDSQNKPIEFDEFDAKEELSTADDLFKANLKRAKANLAEVPAWLNRFKFGIAKAFMSDEQKAKIDELTPEQQDAFAQSIGGISAPGMPNIGAFAKQGQEAAAKLRAEAEELEKNLKQYDSDITTTIFKEGNITEGATRLLTQAIGTIPSIAQAMIPYVGIPSIVAGSAAEASREAVYEEGKNIDLKQQLYATGIGASEGLLELVTKKIGTAAFKNIIGKPKEVVKKTLLETATGIVKAGGAEGLSETGTLALNKFFESKYYNEKGLFEMDEEKWNEFWSESGDTFLIGMATGKGMASTGASATIVRDAVGGRSVRKTLENTNVNEVSEAFTNDNVNDDVVNIARNQFSERQLDIELNRKINLGDITKDKADEIKTNFKNAQGAVKLADDLKIGETLINETVSLVQERNTVANKISKAGDNKALVQTDIDRLAEIDNRLKEISAENQLNITTQKVTDIVKGIENINIEIANSQQEADQIAKDKNLDKKASSSQGFILQNKQTGEQTIVINKDVAKADQAVNVAAHELLHGVLFQTVKNSPETAEALAESIKAEINKIDTSILEDSPLKTRLDQYKSDSAEIQAEETLTLFADAVATGEIKYNESVFTKIGDSVRRLLQQAGLADIKFNKPRDVFNFIKDYNKSIVKGELTQAQQRLTAEAAVGGLVTPAETTQDTQVRESKSFYDTLTPEDLVTVIKSPSTTEAQRAQAETALTNQFDLLALKAIKYDTRAGNIARENVVAEARAELPGIIERFDPSNAKFSTFVTNTMAPKAQQIYENSKNLVQESTSLDSEQARQVADTTPTEVDAKVSKPVTKIDPTKFDKVADKMDNINNIVDIRPEEVATTTFKEVNDKFAGKVASEIFDVPEGKITDPTKNLTYAKKITNGIPENSEAGNIQDFIRVGQNAENFIKILPEENVSSETADINALGENIDVSRDVLGRGLGLNNRVLKYFYNRTNRRSRGKTSQPTIWELKPEFRNPSPETVAKFKEDIGITPAGELNKYDRNIGQILKGIAKLQGQNVANLVARNKVDQADVRTAKPKKQVKADIKSGTSRVMLSKAEVNMKRDASQTRFNDKVSENIKISRIDDAKKSGYTPGKNYTDVPKLMYNRNKKLPESVRSFEGETVIQGMSRVTNNFLARFPQYEQFLNKALTFGVDRSPFGVQELWNKNVTKRGSQDQASFKKPNYTDGKKIRTSWYESTKKPGYVDGEIKKLDDLIQFYRDFNEYYKDNKKDIWFLDEIAVAAQNAQASPLRANAPTLIYEVIPGTKKPLMGVKGVEEHTQPQNEAISILTGGVNNGTFEQAAEAVKATYMQGFLSLENNDLLDVDFKSTMPDVLYKAIDNGLKLDPGLLSSIRLSEAGIDLSSVYYIPTGQTLAEYFFNDNNIDVKTQKELMRDLFEGKSTLKQIRDYGTENAKVTVDKPKVFKKNSNKTTTKFSKSNNNEKLLNDLNSHDKALANSKNIDAPKKGISVFDFDDTVATSKSMVIVKLPTNPDKEILDIGARRLFGDTALKDVPSFLKTFDNLNSEQQIQVLETIPGNIERITPAEFAKRHSELEQQGAEFDFSEFNKVVDGKPGPLAAKLQKAIDKFGNKDVFILTARPQESAGAIYEFLKGIGLELPLENITGLADGTPQAKANWMIGKAAEGYNDFYFADDVYKNVKAVQDALEVLDVKSKSRLAYADRIKKLDRDFNDILEAKTGIGAEKVYSKAKATVVGASKGKFKFFIPPSAEDFVGLLYNTLAKGKLGDNQMAWYKKNLLDPYAKAMSAISRERIALTNDYKALKEKLGVVPKNLRKKIPGDTFTNEQAVRVYIWNKQGNTIPDLSKTDQKELVEYIESKPQYKAFADQLINIHKGDGYTAPNKGWLAGTITTDIQIGLGTTKRAKHLAEWQQNVDIIFSEKNLNKMEAAFGKAHREALESILQRMKTGRNRSFQQDSLTGRVTDWLTNSIGTIMFFNTRSAILQTISSVNFINFGDNNIFKAGKAFANTKQYSKDFMTLMNSDFLVDRRRGIRINVNENDIANMARESGPRGVISKMLELGFLPTQIADSFAIASGGATFYRNRINSLMKGGMDQKSAEEQAMRDFREIAEESQQSSRPDRISAQQAGPLGRVILAFANTPMQYARLIKKAASDLKNGRGDWKTNVSKIVYYSTVQNLIFNALQQAIFAIAFGDTDEEEDTEKYQNIANGMLDSLLRGIGIAGAFTSVGKNAIIRIIRESEKPNPKYEKVGYELTKISPPISSKLSRINQAARAFQWERDEMIDKGFAIDNPALLAGANVISATTNIPVDRLVRKANNVVDATGQDLELWERLGLLGGWQDWELGVEEGGSSKKQTKPSGRVDRGNRVKRNNKIKRKKIKRN